MWPDPATGPSRDDEPILLVHAHPDDESESAALVYRITHESGGIVDQVMVANGERGGMTTRPSFRLSIVCLTTATARRELLGQIRREEFMRSSRITGIRHTISLNRKIQA
jgi:LmbE family N-acetylglucosaminyl deacetylase